MNKGVLALGTVLDVAKTALTEGKVSAPKELVEFRKQICDLCPDFNGTTCGVCGCIMGVKAHLLAAKCPENRWEQKQVEMELFGSIDGSFPKGECCGS